MVAGPINVFVSSAAAAHGWAKVIVWLVQTPALTAHRSCQMPWSWFSPSTDHAKVSPVSGFTASAPRKMGQPGDPVLLALGGQRPKLAIRPAPGWLVMRVQVMPSEDW